MKRLFILILPILILSSCSRSVDPPQNLSPYLEYDLNGKHFEIQGEWPLHPDGGIAFLKNGNGFGYLLSAQNNFNDNDPNNGHITFVIDSDTVLIKTYNISYFLAGWSPTYSTQGNTVNLTITKYSHEIVDGYFSGSVVGNATAVSISGSFKNVHMRYE